jgi:hypothetical protein
VQIESVIDQVVYDCDQILESAVKMSSPVKSRFNSNCQLRRVRNIHVIVSNFTLITILIKCIYVPCIILTFVARQFLCFFKSTFSDFGEIKILEETKHSVLPRQNLVLARTYSTHPIPNLRNTQMIRKHVLYNRGDILSLKIMDGVVLKFYFSCNIRLSTMIVLENTVTSW